MAKKLYGTDPDQVPTNADLGTMAYQDRDYVNVGELNGSGNLRVGTEDDIIWNQSATDNSKEGVVIEPKSLQISRYQDTQALLNRQGNYGANILFAVDGLETGTITSEANALQIRSAKNELYLKTNSSTQFSGTNVGLGPFTVDDAELDLGRFNARYRNLYLSGGVYLGGTGAANYLDDYEEGSIDSSTIVKASVTNPTYTVVTDRSAYQKVGGIVRANFDMSINVTNAGSGHIKIALPFADDSPYNYAQVLGARNNTAFSVYDYQIKGYMSAGELFLVKSTGTGGTEQNITDSDFGTGGRRICFQVIYNTTA